MFPSSDSPTVANYEVTYIDNFKRERKVLFSCIFGCCEECFKDAYKGKYLKIINIKIKSYLMQ